jgi:resuscitation-promoting factor RpfE
MRRILLLAALTLGLPALAFGVFRPAEAQEAGRIDAAFIAQVHADHGHAQYRNGLGTPGHTWRAYRREARRLRIYLYAMAVQRHREQLVRNWQPVANCESHGNWSANTGNGFYGGLQFSMGTWQAYGGSGMPNQAPAWRQSEIADRVRTHTGLGAWPHCGHLYAG